LWHFAFKNLGQAAEKGTAVLHVCQELYGCPGISLAVRYDRQTEK
jgi:hypothetical protein